MIKNHLGDDYQSFGRGDRGDNYQSFGRGTEEMITNHLEGGQGR